MAAQLHHIALTSANFDQTVRFYEEVFQMEVDRIAGQAPERKLWFLQGIQINEVSCECPGNGQWDHVGLKVTGKQQTLDRAFAAGCTLVPGKKDWIVTPDGVVIELMA